MAKIKLQATSDDMDELQAAVDRRGNLSHVRKDVLRRVLLDHARLLQRITPAEVDHG